MNTDRINASYARMRHDREILKHLVQNDAETKMLYTLLDPSSVPPFCEDVTLEILIRVLSNSDVIESVRKKAIDQYQ